LAEFKRGMAVGARAGIPFAILIGLVNTAYGEPSGGVLTGYLWDRNKA